ncbi:MAG: hypothetical protein AAGD09_03595 [Cyanobacteria bacterium P01_F01_bin.56]
MTNVVPWHLPEKEAPELIEEITHEGYSIPIPIYGSVTPDEARWLEFRQRTKGLTDTGLVSISDTVYGLLLLRFKIAVFSGEGLTPLKGKLPTFAEVMCEGDPPLMLPSPLIQKVYFFFIDELNECLGEQRGALTAVLKAEAEKAGQTTTGDSSSTTPATPVLPALPSDNAPSTLLDKPSRPTKPKDLISSTT